MKKGLLLGAGFSYDLGMPLASELTETFLAPFNERSIAKLSSQLIQQQPPHEERPINKRAVTSALEMILAYKRSGGLNYEALLADLQILKGFPTPSQSDRDSYHHVFCICYGIIRHILSLYQQASYEVVYLDNRKWFTQLENLFSEQETWVFTLNHDLYTECLALDFGIPITYGDTGKIRFPVSNLDLKKLIEFGTTKRGQLASWEERFYQNQRGINLVKLHGGLGELLYQDGSLLCNLSLDHPSSRELLEQLSLCDKMAYYHLGTKVPGGGKDRTITNLAGELDIICESLLTGGNKYSKTSNVKDGEEKLKIFDDTLARLDELTVIGYSFGDEHINFRISNALLLNQGLRVTIIDPNRHTVPDCIKQFDYGQRVKRASCGAAHWMHYSKFQTWDNQQIEALKKSDRSAVKARVAAIMGITG